MATRPVTERDLRQPEFRDANIEDLEFRADGKIVRKDRWENGIHSIRSIIGDPRSEFEIQDVIQAVKALVDSIPAPGDQHDVTEDITKKVCSDGS